MSNSEHENQVGEGRTRSERRRRGFELPRELRNERFASAPEAPEDSLMRRLLTLQRLHPEVVRFREAELQEMDRRTLENLLEDFNEALGVRTDVPPCL